MSSLNHKPSFLDRVWVESRIAEDKQPNGYIKKVFWSEEEVLIKYLDDKVSLDTMTFDELHGKWNSRYKIYFIHDEEKEIPDLPYYCSLADSSLD